jgi:hypothetical protein
MEILILFLNYSAPNTDRMCKKSAPPGMPNKLALSQSDMIKLEMAVRKVVLKHYVRAERRELRARWGVRLLGGVAIASALGLGAVGWQASRVSSEIKKIDGEQDEIGERVDKLEKRVDALSSTFNKILTRLNLIVEKMDASFSSIEEGRQESLDRCPEEGECK